MIDANEQFMDTKTTTETMKLDDFDVLSGLNLIDCDNLDPSTTVKVTAEELELWLQESLGETHDDKNMESKDASEDGQDAQKRNSMILGYQEIKNLSRRSSNSTESNFSASVLPQNIQESKGDYDLFDDFLLLPSNDMNQQDKSLATPPPPKRRRTDPSVLREDEPPRAELYDSLSMGAFRRKTMSFIPSSLSVTSSSSSSISSINNSFDSVDVPTGAFCFSDKIKKSTMSLLTPVVPLTLSVSQGLASCMDLSEKSEQEIHAWDRRMGLRKSHSKTMRATGRSRKKLQQLQSQVWQGQKKQFPARMA